MWKMFPFHEVLILLTSETRTSGLLCWIKRHHIMGAIASQIIIWFIVCPGCRYFKLHLPNKSHWVIPHWCLTAPFGRHRARYRPYHQDDDPLLCFIYRLPLSWWRHQMQTRKIFGVTGPLWGQSTGSHSDTYQSSLITLYLAFWLFSLYMRWLSINNDSPNTVAKTKELLFAVTCVAECLLIFLIWN